MLKSPPMVKFYKYNSDFEYDAYDRPVAYIQNRCSTELVYDENRLWLYNKYIRDDNKDLMDLYYEYDGVGNITSVMHDADSIRYLGGAYLQEFQYDAQNRLTRADMLSDYFGEYSNYNLTYSSSGMVGIKSCDDMLWNYWYGFCSINNHIASHQVRSIYDLENDETSYLLYNPEGQVQNIFRPCTGEFRTHRWTEAGQLAGVTDNDRCGYYGYDGNGDRVYKLTGYSVMEQMDANEPVYEAYFSDAVLYVNPYFVVTPKGYTKHIYNGSQRVATHLGRANLQECIDTTALGRERLNNAREYMHALLYQTDEIPIDRNERFVDIDGDDYDELQWQCTDYESQYLIVNIEEVCDSDMLLPTIQQGDPTVTDVFPIYFYHSDHLGSATWITDYYGNVKQFLHYMPYGELFLNQQTSHYNERFKFTGKERDTETGYDYFGARYYSPDLTTWLSPDPLSDKYPSINPYAYCENNPIRYVDPDGKEITIEGNGIIEKIAQLLGLEIGYVRQVRQDIELLKLDNSEINILITQLEESPNTHTIRFPKQIWNKTTTDKVNAKNGIGSWSIIDYDPNNIYTQFGDKREPRVGLAHELQHSLDADKGILTDITINNGIPLDEIPAINTENKVRKQTGDNKRTTYGKKEIPSYYLDD